MENPQYAKTIFYDDFNATQLNRSVWNVSAHGIREGSEHKKLSIWVDSVSTVNQTNGNLNLSMLNYPNYTTTDWDGNPITANFIAGEVNSYEYFSYGIFECNATFANQPGSFPAFWLISGEDCNNIRNNEIDIVELKYKALILGKVAKKNGTIIFDDENDKKKFENFLYTGTPEDIETIMAIYEKTTK